jgi:cysteine synthase A
MTTVKNNTRPAVHSALQAVGNTPLVRLNKIVPEGSAEIYVKLELCNPTGSYKDRMALAMIEEAEKRGDLRPGMTVLEYTGGSTGSSLAFVCAVKGYPFHVISSDAFSQEKLRTMEAFGAQLEIEPSEGGLITPDLIPRMIERARRLAAQPHMYWTDQFNNHDSLLGYNEIGRELLVQLPRIDACCGMVGTAGMLMGISSVLKEARPETIVVALEPSTSAVLSGAEAGKHRVEGTGAGFIPPLFDYDAVDGIRPIVEERGRETARRLAREEGIFAGISSGCNVAGALDIAAELGPGHTVVTVAVDSGLKYLAGDLFI